MSITQAPARVRVESAAKNGTLGSQVGLGPRQIKFDTNISTNNGNLTSAPSFKFRHVIIRRGDADEEHNYITGIDVDGVTATCIDDWDDKPVSGDTYDVSYNLLDVSTFAGCTLETDSLQYAMDSARRLVVGDSTNFAYLGMGNGQILRLSDQGPTTKGLLVRNAGRLDIGAEKNDLGRRGAVIITSHDAAETAIEFENGSVGRLSDFIFMCAKNPDGVRNVVTVGSTADVKWIRSKLIGIDGPFRNTIQRFKNQLTGLLMGTKGDVLDLPEMKGYGWGEPSEGGAISDIGKSIKDELADKATGARARLLIEDDQS